MTRLWPLLLLALAVVCRPVAAVIVHPQSVALALAVLTAAGAVVWFAVDCLRWPQVWEPPAGWSGEFA